MKNGRENEDKSDDEYEEAHAPDELITEGEQLKAIYGDDSDDRDGEYFAAQSRTADECEKPNEYCPDWSEISKAYRASTSYRCEICDINLSDSRHLLHVHHINGDKSNCDSSNLQAECLYCHSQNVGHSHIWAESSALDREKVAKKRRQRGHN